MQTDPITDLNEEDWNTLLDRIAEGKCTPFLGAGVNASLIPGTLKVAGAWAKEFGYPLEEPAELDRAALDKVAEFVAVKFKDPMKPKERFIRQLRSEIDQVDAKRLKNFLVADDQPLGLLASLPLPIYITTNYDDLLMRALKARGKNPRRELCRWNKYVKNHRSVFDSAKGFNPDPNNPVVFHLHGHDEVPESLVLTEDDYLDFLVNISRSTRSKQGVLPMRIEEALTGASLLFLGYRLADINFRVIFKGLVGSLEGSCRRISVSVQLPPDVPGQQPDQIKGYLASYFSRSLVQVFWGRADDFAGQLAQRWARYRGGR